MCMFCRSLLLLFHLVIMLSVLPRLRYLQTLLDNFFSQYYEVWWYILSCDNNCVMVTHVRKSMRVRSLVSLHNTWRVCVEKCWPKLFCLLSIARQYDLVLFNKWAFDWVSSMVEDLRKVWRYQRGNCYVITVIRVLYFVSPYNRSTVSYGETHNILDVNNYFHHYHENDKYSA
jgi:hypothetical protein